MSVVRPNIANLEHEFDARPLQEDPVVTWEDQSGNGNDGTGVNSPVWDPAGWTPANRSQGAVILDPAGGGSHFTFDGSALVGTDLTVFYVAELVAGGIGNIITGGSTTSTHLGMLQIVIAPSGALFFVFFDTQGPPHDDLISAAGLVAVGDRPIVTNRHSSVDGKSIRLNGAEVAANSAGTNPLNSWADPFIGKVQTTSFSKGPIAWISMHSQAVSLLQMQQMEAWLAQEFGPLSGYPRVVEPERASGLVSTGGVKRLTNAGLTQVRSFTGLGWSWQEDYPLLRPSDPVDAELMAFIKNAWHSGQVFSALHPQRPGSGVAPNGLGTASIMVAGAGQVGASVLTDGWPASTAACVVAGDVISIAGEPAVYVVIETAASNGAGEVLIRLNPPLRSTPADNAPVTTTGVTFQVLISNRSKFEPAQPPDFYGGYQVTLSEALL